MELTKTIRYEPQDLRQEFQTILHDLLKQMQIDAIDNSLGTDLSQEISTQVNRSLQALQGNFSLAVVGDFKRGKSTLINALLGAEVVTTNVTPETITINYIEYGTENKIEAILEDEGRVTLASKELYAEQLEPILEQLPPVKHLKIQTPIEWLQGLSLIDTPGTGDIFQRFDRDVQSILEQADAVIFTISALSPLSLSEQNFLQLSLLPQDFPKVFFVVNMLDCVRTDEEAQRLLDAVQLKIDRLFPQAQLFGISARDEFTRILCLSRPNIQRADVLEKTFADFRATLEDSILVNRNLIQLHRIAGRVDRDLSNWKSQIILLQEGIKSERVDLDRAIAQCQDKSSELSAHIEQHKQQMKIEIGSLSTEAIGWIDDFFDRLQTETVSSLAQYQLEDIHRHYNFFLADSIHKAVASCLEVHRPVIIDILNKSASNIAGELHLLKQSSFETPDLAKTSLEQYQWTNLDTLQTILRITPLGAIADLLIHQVKKSASNSKVGDYQRQLQKSLLLLKSSLSEQVSSIYCNIAEQLEEELDTIAQSKIDASISTFQQAQNLSIQGKHQISVTNKNLDNALSVLIKADDTLANFQHKLWS